VLHEADARPRADGQESEVVDTPRDTGPPLADGREIDVVVERDGCFQPFADFGGVRATFEACDVRLRQAERFGQRLDDTGNAEHDAVDALDRQGRAVDQRAVQCRNRIERAVGVGATKLDVLARADAAGEVGDGAAQKARAQVQAEHECSVGNWFEEHGAVAGAVGTVHGLADEPRVLECPQRERNGRLRDADTPRDLRPRDRCARPDRLQDGALIHVLQQWRRGACQIHPVKKINSITPKSHLLDSISGLS
jgi:hypothetical protein